MEDADAAEDLAGARGNGRRRRNASRRGKKASTLAALRAARDGELSRTDQWEGPEEEAVYDEVDEDTYRRIVGERRQREDFVVDDDGLGYYDDGEEHFGEAEEIRKPQQKKPHTSAHDVGAVKRARKLNAERVDDEAPTNQNQMWRYLGKKTGATNTQVVQSSALDSLESLIDGVGRNTTKRTISRATPTQQLVSRRQTIVPPSESAAALARAQLPSHVPRSAVAPRHLYDDDDDVPPQPEDDDDGVPPQPEDDDVVMPSPEVEEPPPAKKSSRFSKEKHATVEASAATRRLLQGSPTPNDEQQGETVAVETPANEGEEKEAPSSDECAASSTPMKVNAQNVDESRWLVKEESAEGEETSHCHVYWLDATLESNGKVYVIGKIRLTDGNATTYASCCVEVRNLERCMFVLPREKDGVRYEMGDVFGELRSVLCPAYVPSTRPLKCKQVKRAYAFGDTSIPRDADTTYLKVKYAADLKPPSKSLCEDGGRTFEKILGAGSSPLELFLLKRKLMGPGWLRIDNPKASVAKVSHCALELFVDDPKQISVERNSSSSCGPAPPLIVSTVSIKTAVNPKTHVHEIVAAAVLTHHNVAIDQATEDSAAEDADLLFKAARRQTRQKKRWTLLAVRPLGHDFLKAGLTTAIKLPRDLEAQRKSRPSCLNDGVTCAPNERALISCLLARLGAEDPDVLVGHNISGFELDVLIGRALALKLSPRQWSKLGRLNHTRPPAKWKSQQTGRDSYSASTTAGRLVCDTYVAAKEHLRSATTYDLVTLAKTQLVDNRLKYGAVQPADVPRFLETGAATCDLLVHVATAARLVERLAIRLQVLPLSKQLTTISGNLMTRTLKGNRAERIEYLLLHEFHRLKYIAPEKERRDDDNDKKRKKKASSGPSYSGGLVLEPKRGFYDTFILLMDFASLYPSIIQEYDICFTTLEDWTKYNQEDALEEQQDEASSSAGKKKKNKKTKKDQEQSAAPLTPELPAEEDDEDDVDAMEEATQLLLPPVPERVGEPKGVLPKVLKSLIAKRREVKQLLKNEKDPVERRKYDIRQMALKLTANSMYGCLGFSHSRFYAKPLAALVTSLGRETLQATANVAQHDLGLEVIYGDTDSIMINTRATDLKTVKEIGANVRTVVNRRYKLLELELDGIFKSMLLLKKKKYAALVVKSSSPDANGGETLTFDRETKGLDLVRRDWCELSKRAGGYVLDRILSGESSEVVVADIHAYLEQLGRDARDGKIPLSDFVITKGLNKAVDKYPDSKTQPHLRVAKAMIKEGRPVNVGDHIPYIICEGKGKGPADRSYHPDVVKKALKEQEEQAKPPSTPGGIAQPGDESSGASIVTPAPTAAVEEPPSSPPSQKKEVEEEKIRVDVRWYLSQQIFPPISRLCEPIAATSAAVLAAKLGLDARPLAHAAALANEAMDAEAASTFTPASAMTDTERFGACVQLEMSCAECGRRSPLPLWPKKGAQESSDLKRKDAFECPSCASKWLGTKTAASCFSRVSTALALACRRRLSEYYEGWLLCDDPTCGARTRQISCAGPCCPVPTCKGRMFPEASERALYTQLKYFEALFDQGRYEGGGGSPEHAEVLSLLQDQIKEQIENSAYNYIQPSVFSAFFSQLHNKRQQQQQQRRRSS